jgi:hypothetical protein
VQDIWEFHRWLADRVRADYPQFHIVALVTGDAEYRAGNYVLDMVLREHYGTAAGRMEKMLELRRRLRETDSVAHRLFLAHGIRGAVHVGVVEINIHQSQIIHGADNPRHPMGTLAHETAHVLGEYARGTPAGWTRLHEEAAADLFEVAAMAVWGAPDYGDHLVFRRLRTRFNDAALLVNRDYGYPVLAEQGRELARRYAGVDRMHFSPAALRRDVEGIVWHHRARLQAWHDFAAAANDQKAAHRRPGAAVMRELTVEHPIASDIEAVVRFAPTTASHPGEGRSWRGERVRAEKAALAAMQGAPCYYVAINDNIAAGTWKQPKLAGQPVVR